MNAFVAVLMCVSNQCSVLKIIISHFTRQRRGLRIVVFPNDLPTLLSHGKLWPADGVAEYRSVCLLNLIAKLNV
jgi:hypothetical protein